jgi:hypothetical protein
MSEPRKITAGWVTCRVSAGGQEENDYSKVLGVPPGGRWLTPADLECMTPTARQCWASPAASGWEPIGGDNTCTVMRRLYVYIAPAHVNVTPA